MNSLVSATNLAAHATVARDLPRRHALGPVADDWEAVDVWLGEVQAKNRNGSMETVATYRFHLAKLRWYCEQILHLSPAEWSAQEVRKFREFLKNLPESALCAQEPAAGRRGAGGAMRFVTAHEPGWTPFRQQLSDSSQKDILRCVHAMFSAWHGAGYIAFHPMAMAGAPTPRKVNVNRAIPLDLYDLVLAGMALEVKTTYTQRQKYLRDRFILIALRELGLRASELVHADMGAFFQVTMPRTGERYWIFGVSAQTGKGGVERHVPATLAVWDAFVAYRVAFGFSPYPQPGDSTKLVLSTRTKPMFIGAAAVKHATDRRFFQAWRHVETRQGLYSIVKGRLVSTAGALEAQGMHGGAAQLRKASPHWLRHTFGKSALLAGQRMREVVAAMGHADERTTQRYTVQAALDLIEAWERETPGVVARDKIVAVNV